MSEIKLHEITSDKWKKIHKDYKGTTNGQKYAFAGALDIKGVSGTTLIPVKVIPTPKMPIHIITSINGDHDSLCGIPHDAAMEFVGTDKGDTATCPECRKALPEFLKLEARLAEIIANGFDKSYLTVDHTIRVRCSSCEALCINSTPTHETGCPEAVSHYMDDDEDEEGDYTPFQPDE